MKPKILVVDDEQELVEVIEDFINMSDMNVDFISANSVDEALKKVSQHDPSVIVSDVSMPMKTGFDFLRELRAKKIMTPVLIISGFGDKKTIKKAWELGAFDFLDKPLNQKDLIDKLKVAMTLGHDFNLARSAPRLPEIKFALDYETYGRVAERAKKSNVTVEEWVKALVAKELG